MTEIETLLLAKFKEFLKKQDEVFAILSRQLNEQCSQVDSLHGQVSALASRVTELSARLPK